MHWTARVTQYQQTRSVERSSDSGRHETAGSASPQSRGAAAPTRETCPPRCGARRGGAAAAATSVRAAQRTQQRADTAGTNARAEPHGGGVITPPTVAARASGRRRGRWGGRARHHARAVGGVEVRQGGGKVGTSDGEKAKTKKARERGTSGTGEARWGGSSSSDTASAARHVGDRGARTQHAAARRTSSAPAEVHCADQALTVFGATRRWREIRLVSQSRTTVLTSVLIYDLQLLHSPNSAKRCCGYTARTESAFAKTPWTCETTKPFSHDER